MNKKMIVAMVTGVLLVSYPTMTYVSSSLTINQAAQQIEENNLDQQKTIDDPKVDSNVQIYQSRFSDEMEDIQEVSNEYQELVNELSRELQAYTSLYNYWSLGEQVRISEEGLELAEDQMSILSAQYTQGLVSEAQMIEMEQSINTQKAQHRGLVQQLNSMKFMVNQDLRQPLMSSISLDTPTFKKLPLSVYNAKNVADEMTKSHESLRTPRTIVATYEDILDDAEDLSPIGTGSASTSHLSSALTEVTAELTTIGKKLADTSAANPLHNGTALTAEQIEQLTTRKADLERQAALLQTQIGMMNAQRPDVASTSKAERQLTAYYKDKLSDANVDLINQIDAIELLAYQYEETFNSLAEQLDLMERNRDLASQLYDKEMARFRQGMSTQSNVNQARQSLEQAEVHIIETQKDYLIAKKEFELFTEKGYLPVN